MSMGEGMLKAVLWLDELSGGERIVEELGENEG